MATVTLKPAQSADDARQANGGTMTLNGATIAVVSSNSASSRYHGGVRFDTATTDLLRYATVTSATLRVYATGASGWNGSIYGDAADDSAAFTSDANNITGRTRTTAAVAVNSASITAGAGYTEYDVKAIVEEITSRDGWANGNALTMLWISSSTSRTWTFSAYDNVGTEPNLTELVIVYTPYSIPSNPVPDELAFYETGTGSKWLTDTGAATYSHSATYAYTGTQSLRAATTSTTNLAFWTQSADYFAVTAGQWYPASAMVRGSDAKRVVLSVNWFTSGGTWITYGIIADATCSATDWTRYTGMVLPPATAAKCQLKIEVFAPTIGGYYYFDEFTLGSIPIAGTDSGTLTETGVQSEVGGGSTSIAASDSVTLTDAVTAVTVAAVATEALTATDTIRGAATLPSSVDSLTVTDATTNRGLAGADPFAVTDNITARTLSGHADTGTFDNASTAPVVTSLRLTGADSGTLTDGGTVTLSGSTTPSSSDSVTLTEVSALQSWQALAAADAGTAIEAVAVAAAASSADSLLATRMDEQVTNFARSGHGDDIALTDAAAARANTLDDAATLSEASSLAITNFVAASDAGTVAEGRSASVVASRADGAFVDEQIENLGIAEQHAATDAIAVTDAAAVAAAAGASDAGMLTDATSGRGVGSSDAGTFSDDATGRSVGSADSFAATDAAVFAGVLQGVAGAESASLAETSSIVVGVVASDAATGTDSSQSADAASSADVSSLSEAAAAMAGVAAAEIETVTEASSSLLAVAQADAGTLSDAAASLARASASADTGTLTDASQSTVSFPASDAASFADATSTVTAAARTTDSAALSEASQAVTAWQSSDSATVSDASAVTRATAVSAVESLVVTDGMSSFNAGVTGSDNATVADAAGFGSSDQKTASDAFQVTDAFSAAGRSASDSASLSESAHVVVMVIASDNATESESVMLGAVLRANDMHACADVGVPRVWWYGAQGDMTADDVLARVQGETDVGVGGMSSGDSLVGASVGATLDTSANNMTVIDTEKVSNNVDAGV